MYVVDAFSTAYSLLFCLCMRVVKCSQAQTSKSNAGQEEGSASNLMQGAGNPTEEGSNIETDPAVGNAGNDPADNPESDPQPVTQSSNIQVSDLAEGEAQDAPKN